MTVQFPGIPDGDVTLSDTDPRFQPLTRAYIDDPRPPVVSEWKVGGHLDVLDPDGCWYRVVIREVRADAKERTIKVHYEGCSDRFDEVVSMDSDRLAPDLSHSIPSGMALMNQIGEETARHAQAHLMRVIESMARSSSTADDSDEEKKDGQEDKKKDEKKEGDKKKEEPSDTPVLKTVVIIRRGCLHAREEETEHEEGKEDKKENKEKPLTKKPRA